MRTLLLCCALSLPMFMLVSPPARAQDSSVEGLLRKGHEALERGQEKQALEAYRAAFAKEARFDTAANLGLLELASGQAGLAAGHLELAAGAMYAEIDPILQKEIRLKLAEAKKRAPYEPATEPATEPAAAPDAASGLSTGQTALITVGSLLSLGGLGAGAALLIGASARDGNKTEKVDALQAATGSNDCVAQPDVCGEITNNEEAAAALPVAGARRLAAGGALAAGTIIYGMLAAGSSTEPKSSTATLMVLPLLDPRGANGASAGIQLVGQF